MIKCFNTYASHYRSKHVIFTLGVDFAYVYAEPTFHYIESIVDIIKSSPNGCHFKFVYSTVSEYVDAVT